MGDIKKRVEMEDNAKWLAGQKVSAAQTIAMETLGFYEQQ